MGGYHQTHVYRWEGRHTIPTAESILLVAKALGIPAAWLVTPWPVDETSRAILREASGLTAKTRWELMGEVRDMIAERIYL